MADSAVSFVLEHLSQLVAQEATLLCGVEDRVKSLHNELEIINVFLQTSSKSRKQMEQKVINQIRDVAYLAEDVIDTFVAKVSMHKKRSMMGRVLHGVEHARLLRDVAQKVDKIKTSLNEIRENKIKYDEFQECNNQSTEEEERAQSLHKRRRNVEEEDVVGFVQASEAIVKRLVEGGSRRNVVSIIGMGGLGKTTLARRVYNSEEVKRCFSCCAWVYVSNECRVRELLLGLLEHLMPNLACEGKSNRKKGKKHQEIGKPRHISRMSEDELKEMVRECLRRKRYLLVLDDLWNKQDWDEVQDAFPDNNRGSRILITSRLKEVASHTSHDPPYCLQFLNEEESWELFCKKVFRGEEYSSELESLGKQIVQSCRGLPLSIVVLAGLLANKEKSHREWSKVVGHVNWYLTQDETQVKDIVLKLSYDNLPTKLKPCFLYLGIFPEDSEILVRPLLQRWVAEGFIQQSGSRDPDDVAEDYLYELLDRSLIQVARMKTGGGVKTCRIHDLLRDLCISESKEDKVFEVCTDNNILIPTKPRRLSIHCSTGHYISSSNNDHSCIRSLFCFGPHYIFLHWKWKWLFKSFKLVRVLDLGQDSCFGRIPSNLGDFIHLRYLRIELVKIARPTATWGTLYTWGTRGTLSSQLVATIPTSILTLWNLQTLDLGRWRWRLSISFPCGMWKLKHLRHLYACGPIMLRGHDSRSDQVMWNLQTISSIVFNRKITSLIEKGSLPNLKKMGLQISSDGKGKLLKLLPSLQQLSHLSELTISLSKENYRDPDNIECYFGCKPQELLESLKLLSNLTTLKIVNALDLPTCAVPFPSNVTKLTLRRIRDLNDDGMNALGNLTKLRILRLSGTSDFQRRDDSACIDLNCDAGWFPQLQMFEMSCLHVLNWNIANDAMPCLQSLIIDRCDKLNGLPSELWSLTTLRKVQVSGPSQAMAHMLRNLEVKSGCDLVVKDHGLV